MVVFVNIGGCGVSNSIDFSNDSRGRCIGIGIDVDIGIDVGRSIDVGRGIDVGGNSSFIRSIFNYIIIDVVVVVVGK
uniref:Uncharacterized protein n=1 Tax=Spodoptera exigua multiple nucleopolyhedrovirus TaxID=10454 RepID=A0A6N0CAQ7_9ABAC|nr:hypothetical protein [Spodoptera exigua multiple nucleopolyhedrovirus]